MRLLQWTSLAFALPLWVAWQQQAGPLYVCVFLLHIPLSFYYHTTYKPWVRALDMGFVHAAVLYLKYRAAACGVVSAKTLCFWGAGAYAAAVYWLLNLSTRCRRGQLWHASIHLASVAGSTALFLERQCPL